MNENDFRKLKIDLQLEQLKTVACEELDRLGFIGVSKIVNFGSYDFHLTVDKTFLNAVRQSPRLWHYNRAINLINYWIDQGHGDTPIDPCPTKQPIKRPWGIIYLPAYIFPKGTKPSSNKTTWKEASDHIKTKDLVALAKEPNSFLMVDAKQYKLRFSNRNGGVALLSSFLLSLDNKRFDYLREVVDFYSAYVALEEGSLTRLPNCKLSKQYTKQGEENG